MAIIEGIGTCLVPNDGGIPCGTQIEQGEPIRTIQLRFGGAVVGHKRCVDAYEARKTKEDDDMVKRVDQSGPGGAVDMTQATDALVGSYPLETRKDGTLPSAPEPVPEGAWGEDVKPVASIPLGSPPPEAQLPAHEPAMMREFTPPKDPVYYDPDEMPQPGSSAVRDDLDNRFTYHPPTEEQIQKYQEIRDFARQFSHILVDLCPDSSERLVALNALDSCVFFANASIARNS